MSAITPYVLFLSVFLTPALGAPKGGGGSSGGGGGGGGGRGGGGLSSVGGSSEDEGLSKGAIAGITVGSIVFCICVVAGVKWYNSKKTESETKEMEVEKERMVIRDQA